MKLTCTINKDQSVSLELSGKKTLVNGKEFDYQLTQKKSSHYQLMANGKSHEIRILSVEGDQIWMLVDDYELRLETKNELDLMMMTLGVATGSAVDNPEVLAPMPGTILDIMVSPGQKVKKGDSLLVLNAMKMENVIKAPGDGEVYEISVSAGDNVNKNQVLISFSV